MKPLIAYGLAGAVLTATAVWIIRTRQSGERLGGDPLEEVERMMSQTRQKVSEIRQNSDDFRQVLAKATTLDASIPSTQPQ